jgi:hypothetical protein
MMNSASIGDQFATVAHIGLIAEQFLRDYGSRSLISPQVKAIYRQALDALTVGDAQLAAERNAQRSAE